MDIEDVVKALEFYIIRGSRCVGMIATRSDGQPSFWPLDLPAHAVPLVIPTREREQC